MIQQGKRCEGEGLFTYRKSVQRGSLRAYAMNPTMYGRVMKIGTTGVGASANINFARLRPEMNLRPPPSGKRNNPRSQIGDQRRDAPPGRLYMFNMDYHTQAFTSSRTQ
jgi:hypothetical protein